MVLVTASSVNVKLKASIQSGEFKRKSEFNFEMKSNLNRSILITMSALTKSPLYTCTRVQITKNNGAENSKIVLLTQFTGEALIC